MELINRKLLLFAQSINIPNFGTVYPPKLRDFLEFDYGKFKSSFSVRKEIFIDNTNSDYDKIKDFDILIFSNMIENLIQSLKLLYKTDNVKLETPKKDDIDSIQISIKSNDNIYYINRNNYTEFADMILIILHEGNNIADKKVKKELTEIELKMERKKREFERKKRLREIEQNKDKKQIGIFDLANYLIHVDSKYTYDNVLDLTIYQLINSYQIYQQKENYDLFVKYKTNGNFKIEDELKHWFFNK